MKLSDTLHFKLTRLEYPMTTIDMPSQAWLQAESSDSIEIQYQNVTNMVRHETIVSTPPHHA